MAFDRDNFIDDKIDISDIHLTKALLNLIDEYKEAIKNENKIKCEDLQWSLETYFKNAYGDGVFSYGDWKRLEAKFRIW